MAVAGLILAVDALTHSYGQTGGGQSGETPWTASGVRLGLDFGGIGVIAGLSLIAGALIMYARDTARNR